MLGWQAKSNNLGATKKLVFGLHFGPLAKPDLSDAIQKVFACILRHAQEKARPE
jgi:hypothetical protein